MSDIDVVDFEQFKSGGLSQREPYGKVTLVGAGPGDPELLTIKAVRAIEEADLILYDRLVSEKICRLFPKKTPALYVGKIKNRHSISQDKLNALLVSKAKQGFNICRLKGGDSFIFGRGSEEMLTLKKAGIKVQVIPGITAASGCTTYAGIPLTHRGLSQGCSFITGHAEKSLVINWAALVSLGNTLVFYMGLSQIKSIEDNLTSAGMKSSMPVALIENGCNPQQRVITGELGRLSDLARINKAKSPTLIVIGEVVSLAGQLEWFEDLLPDGEKNLSA